jgi:hypothetical protein
MLPELHTAIFQRRIANLEQESEENGERVIQLRDDILTGEICQDEFTARLDRVREVHSKLRAELDALARDAGVGRGKIAS